jgi:nitroreductase
MFKQTVTQVIQSRISCRTYDPKPIPQDKLDEMTQLLTSLNTQAQSQLRFTLINSTQTPRDKTIKLGSYGVLSGVHTFMIATIGEKGDPFELGTLFETAILKATDLGLGTVWLGGTFNRSDFEKQLTLSPDEAIAIVSPLGIPKDKRSLIDSAMRFGAGSNNRKAWSELFFDQDLTHPLSKETAHEYAEVLDLVRVGPSASNKQPWRFVKDQHRYHLFLDRTPGYGSMMKYDLQLNDGGIAKCHFELACIERQLSGSWKVLDPKPECGPWEYLVSWVYES